MPVYLKQCVAGELHVLHVQPILHVPTAVTLKPFKNLVVLTMDCWHVAHVPQALELFQSIGNLRGLECLQLFSCERVTTAHLAPLVSLERLHYLEAFCLGHLVDFHVFARFSSLRVLNVGGASALTHDHLRHFPVSLEALGLSNCRQLNEFLLPSQLSRLCSLREVNVENTVESEEIRTTLAASLSLNRGLAGQLTKNEEFSVFLGRRRHWCLEI
jgi:hypothetical protein